MANASFVVAPQAARAALVRPSLVGVFLEIELDVVNQDLAVACRLGDIAANDPLEKVRFLPGIGAVAIQGPVDVLLLFARII